MQRRSFLAALGAVFTAPFAARSVFEAAPFVWGTPAGFYRQRLFYNGRVVRIDEYCPTTAVYMLDQNLITQPGSNDTFLLLPR
jgi:hypothetical protein